MAKKNTNYGAIIKDGFILMAIGLAFAFIVKFGFDQLRGDVKENPIITALLQDDFDKIKKNIDKEPEALNQQDEQGRTPLMWVSYLNYGNRDLINKTSKDESGKEKQSIAGERLEMAKLLVSNKADLAIKDEDDWSALTWASWSGLPKIVSLLIDNGAVVDVVDKKGQTPLMIASQRGNDETVKILLAAGADKELKNRDGLSAINFAENYMVKFSDRKVHYQAVIEALKAPFVPKPAEEEAAEQAEESTEPKPDQDNEAAEQAEESTEPKPDQDKEAAEQAEESTEPKPDQDKEAAEQAEESTEPKPDQDKEAAEPD